MLGKARPVSVPEKVHYIIPKQSFRMGRCSTKTHQMGKPIKDPLQACSGGSGRGGSVGRRDMPGESETQDFWEPLRGGRHQPEKAHVEMFTPFCHFREMRRTTRDGQAVEGSGNTSCPQLTLHTAVAH